MLEPQLPGSFWCSRNLSSRLLKQWGEHVRLWHMVARVTCSLCLTLNFWPWETGLPTLMTLVLLHLPPCSLSTHHLVPPLISHVLVHPSQIFYTQKVCVLHAPTPYFSVYNFAPYSCSFTVLQAIKTNNHFEWIALPQYTSVFFSWLHVCCLSLQTKGRLGPRHQISINPQSTDELLPPAG